MDIATFARRTISGLFSKISVFQSSNEPTPDKGRASLMAGLTREVTERIMRYASQRVSNPARLPLLRSLHLGIPIIAAASLAQGESYRTGAIEAEGVTDIIPRAINDNGVVVGVAKFGDDFHAFRWEDGTLIRLETPDGCIESIAYDINDDGLIVGAVEFPWNFGGGRPIGAVWEATKETSSVTVMAFSISRSSPAPPSEFEYGSQAFSVNNENVIVGGAGIDYISDVSGNPVNESTPAVSSGGGWSELVSLSAPATGYKTGGFAFKINDHGVVLGRGVFGPDRAFLAGSGGYQILEINPGFQGLSNEGHVVGYSSDTSVVPVARMWDGANYIDLDTARSQAIAVNDSGLAVGRQISNLGRHFRYGVGMLYRAGESPQYLQWLASTGWTIQSGTDINNDGTIVGVGTYQGVQTAYWMSPSSGGLLLEGTVRDENGQPVPSLSVVVENSSGSQEILTTDPDGYYSVNLPLGNYFVWAEPWGQYRPSSTVCPTNSFICLVDLDRPRVVDFNGTSTADTPDSYVTETQFQDGVFTVRFAARPGVDSWSVVGSENLASFPIDLNSEATVEETSPGNYLMTLEQSEAASTLFVRIEEI